VIRGARRSLGAGLALLVFLAPVAAAGDAATRDLARRRAEDILGERRFQDPDLPSPLRGPLTWIGDRVQSLLDVIFSPLEGAAALGWIILGAVVVAAVAVIAYRLSRRRADVDQPAGTARPASTPASADDLEREADACEEAGNRAQAVRLRFRAGLLRLAADGAIPRANAITNREVARRSGSPSFPGVARSFEEIVYGDRPAHSEDLDLSREGWKAVRREASARPGAAG
jgi:Domain of unknown function (DUF4129)